MSNSNASHVVLETTMGQMSVELYWDHAPRTCMNFQELARKGFNLMILPNLDYLVDFFIFRYFFFCLGYYNNTIFHRIIADFMVQGGDPTGTGKCRNLLVGSETINGFLRTRRDIHFWKSIWGWNQRRTAPFGRRNSEFWAIFCRIMI